MTAPDPHSGSVPPPRPPAGPAYPPPMTYPPDPMSAPPGSFSGPPAPYSVSPAAPTPARRSRGALFALGVAALALLVAAASLLVAWRAVDQAGDARDIALAAGSQTEPPATQAPAPATSTQGPPTEPTPADAPVEPAPGGSGTPPPLDERTVYTPHYEGQSLTLKLDGCNKSMSADLDEPRANAGTGIDLTLHHLCNGDHYLSVGDGVEGSLSAAPGATPHDCVESIRTTPLGGSNIPVRKGTVICLTTSAAAAQERGDSRRVVRVEITGVAEDGAVTIKGTAWDIPR